MDTIYTKEIVAIFKSSIKENTTESDKMYSRSDTSLFVIHHHRLYFPKTETL